MTAPNNRFYNYINISKISVIGIDTKAAYELKMLDSELPTDGGISITENVAAQMNKKEGDILSFYGDKGKKYDLKILSVTRATRMLAPTKSAIICSPDLCNEISGNDKGSVIMMYASVPADKLTDTISSLSKKYPSYDLWTNESTDSSDTMDSMLNIYYLIFAVVFLMVCFIVVSMSRQIVNERMSVIGMMRSLGGSISSTGLLLLAESAFYGLCGGALGSLLFLPFRGNSELAFFAAAGDIVTEKSDGINILTILLVILAVILIQCIFSLSAIIRASKTPVRDIIFGTTESAYIPSKLLSTFGVFLIAIGIVSFLICNDFALIIISAFCSTVGIVILFPMLISLLSKVLSALFRCLKIPVAKLAIKEIASTKSNVSSAQLILSAMSLTIAVLIIAASLISFLAEPVYQTELMIYGASQNGSLYDNVLKNLDGVQDVENIYLQSLSYESKAELNGELREMYLIGYPDGGFRYFNGIRDCPDTLAENEAAIDKILASKLSINVGDEISLKVRLDKYLPHDLKLKVKCLVDAGYFNSMGNTVMINLDNYKSIFYDKPQTVLIKTEPGKELKILDILKSTLNDYPSNIMTLEEYSAETKANMDSILTVIYAVVFLGFALSLLGTSSNLIMCFEQSRRKYAVYYSTSMSKDKLKKLILAEIIMTNSISIITAILYGLFFLQITSRALSLLSMSVPLVHPLLYSMAFGAAAFVILMIVVIKPLRMLSKMNIAEEIKTAAD